MGHKVLRFSKNASVSELMVSGILLIVLLFPVGTGHAEISDLQPIDTLASRPSERILTVASYNIAGLPFPIKSKREQAIARIAEIFGILSENQQQPDVLLIQEGFMDGIQKIASAAGYGFTAKGPDTSSLTGGALHPREMGLAPAASFWRGETVGPVLSSGLHILSRYPILNVQYQAFGACAGYDCLANKGALMVQLDVPGVPDPVEVVTTHLNAGRAAGVSMDRALEAHKIQMDKLSAFLAFHTEPANPLILGADLNTKNSSDRIRHAEARLAAYTGTRDHCLKMAETCTFSMPDEERKSWLTARDIQAFRDGARVTITPIESSFWFDQADDRLGEPLSDHPAIFAAYRLSWHAPVQLAQSPKTR